MDLMFPLTAICQLNWRHPWGSRSIYGVYSSLYCFVGENVALKLCCIISPNPFLSTLLCKRKHKQLVVWVTRTVLTSCCFPAVMEYQLQINSVETKLQETRARKKQQEELIMKVENQALKVSNEHTLMLIFFFSLTVLETRSACTDTWTKTCRRAWRKKFSCSRSSLKSDVKTSK